MKQFTISIPENKVLFFLELMKSMPFVKSIKEATSNYQEIPEEHKNIVRERIESNNYNKAAYKDWKEIEDELNLD